MYAIRSYYAHKFGRGVEGIFHIGDGYDDLIAGLKARNNFV